MTQAKAVQARWLGVRAARGLEGGLKGKRIGLKGDEARQAPRAPFTVPVSVEAPGIFGTTSTLNVSTRGLLIRDVGGLSAGTEVSVRVLLPDRPLRLAARVLRRQREFWAIEFIDAPADVLRQLGVAVEEWLDASNGDGSPGPD
jgi:hypothetical protein